MSTRDISLSILSVGSELLDGRIQDRNAQFLAREAQETGFQIAHIMSCDDKLEDIQQCLGFLSQHSRFIVVSGGLGPTEDDLTRDALAAFGGTELGLREDALKRLEEKYQRRKRVMHEANRKQALFPISASLIENPIGTAEGFYLEKEETFLAALPGVPREFQSMLLESVFPYFASKSSGLSPKRKSTLRLFGLPESEVGALVSACPGTKSLEVSYRASFPEIRVQLTGPDTDTVQKTVLEVEKAIGPEFVYSKEASLGLPETVHELCLKKGIKLALAESCTGGLVSEMLSSFPGASAYFQGSVVSYSNAVKEAALGVDHSTLQEKGAVSFEVAEQMAQGALEKLKADIALSITGIAGPDGGSEEKPVGTFYIGCATEGGRFSRKFFHQNERKAVQRFAAFSALDILRRKLLQLPIPGDSATK